MATFHGTPNVATPLAPSSHWPAIGYKLASAAVLACMFALIKSLGDEYPIGEIVFVRSFFALVPVLWLVNHLGGWRVLRTARPGAHLIRSTAGLCSLFLSFAAVSMLPLGTAMALGYAAPLFITILAAPLLGEVVRPRHLLITGVGFVGVLLVVQPDAEGISPAALIALMGAVATAIALISIRQMAETEANIAIVFYFTLSGTIIGAATLPFAAVWPNPADLSVLVAIGVLGGIAQILLTKAYHVAPASVIAPFEYATLVFAIGLGLLIWGEFPTTVEFCGITLIVASTLFLALKEHRNGTTRSQKTPSATDKRVAGMDSR